MYQVITFENITSPGFPIHVGDTFRVRVPVAPKGKCRYEVTTYIGPMPFDRPRYADGLPMERDGTAVFVLGDAPGTANDGFPMPGDQLYAYLTGPKGYNAPLLGIGNTYVG